jgi:hypothetical protein
LPVPIRPALLQLNAVRPKSWVPLGRTLCEVCGISVLELRRFEYGKNRCRLHRLEAGER